MCLLIAQKIGAEIIPTAHLREGWKGNKDGAGYCFVKDGRIETKKFTRLKPFLAEYRADHTEFGGVSPFIVHLRFSTHGGVSAENTHPFPLANGRVAFAHNGMLCEFESPRKDESDTRFFARTVLARRSASQLMSGEFIEWLGDIIGDGNKFALISDDGTLAIVNVSRGHWIGDTWYSNHDYIGPRTNAFPRPYSVPDIDPEPDVDFYTLGWDSVLGPNSVELDPDTLNEAEWLAYHSGRYDAMLELEGYGDPADRDIWHLG